jgi:hypothetical protein
MRANHRSGFVSCHEADLCMRHSGAGLAETSVGLETGLARRDALQFCIDSSLLESANALGHLGEGLFGNRCPVTRGGQLPATRLRKKGSI